MYQQTHALKFKGYFKPEENHATKLIPAENFDSVQVMQILERQDRINNQEDEDEDDSQQPTVIQAKDIIQIGIIGRGVSGAVYKVQHKKLGIYMAKKAIYNDTGAIGLKQVARELNVIRKCNSPFIARYYGAYREDATVCLFTEYMNLGSLDRILKKTGAFPPHIVRHVNACVVNALVYLKAINVTHRDIKPSNILLNKEGEVKICDFGVCGILVDSVAMSFLGSSHYMAPERLAGNKYTDTGDVWSLGLTIIELLLGSLPTLQSCGANSSAFSVLQAAQQKELPQMPPSAPQDIAQYVQKCLKVDPNERIPVMQLENEPVYKAVDTNNKAEMTKWLKSLRLKRS